MTTAPRPADPRRATPRALMAAAMRRQPTERIPVMPQICHDVALRIHADEDGRDWIDGLKRCVEDPEAVHDQVIRLVEEVNCDGLRLFVRDGIANVVRAGDQLMVVDPDSGTVTGSIDTLGGGGFIPAHPPPPVQTVGEARQRLDAQVRRFSDEALERLRRSRARVPDRFVASSPGGITMNTYAVLRGREQAMFDLVDRPDFVSAVMELQVDAAIRQAEKLLSTGIDAFYIGDPSASGSLLGPWHFERYCLPAYQRFCSHFRDADILIYIHVCGNANPILEMLADTGAHTVEPLDPLGGVEVADARNRIGERTALMGGVNTLTLARGTPAEVRKEAIRKCREAGPRGYILAAGDMVPPETSLENLQALVDVATESLWKRDEDRTAPPSRAR